MNFGHSPTIASGPWAYPYPGRSEKIISGSAFSLPISTAKKLIVCVRPGVLLTRASLVPVRELSSEDLPTFDRPRKAISGAVGAGNCAGEAAEVRKRAKTFIVS